MLELDNLKYASPETVLFQRCTVIVTDVALLVGALALCRALWPPASAAGARGRRLSEAAHVDADSRVASATALVLTCINAGLLLVDHVHFQYNGFLIGCVFYFMFMMI